MPVYSVPFRLKFSTVGGPWYIDRIWWANGGNVWLGVMKKAALGP